MHDNTLVKLESLSKIYSGAQPVYALNNINLSIQSGEFISIIGPSGSGKSTLMNMIGLLDKPSKGKLYYREHETSQWNDTQKAIFRNKEIGFIFQSHLLLPEFNAVENVMMPAFISEKKSNNYRDRAEAILCAVGLGDRLYNKPSQLSGGQNQRVAIARALMNNPSVVLADEPTGALDQKTSSDIYNLFRKINKESGMTFVIVTHERNLANKADRLIELVDGKIINDERK